MDLGVKMFINTTGGGGRGVETSPERFAQFPDVLKKRFSTQLNSLGAKLRDQLVWGYAVAIRERPRREGKHLSQRLAQALTFSTGVNANEVWLGVFELGLMDRLTRNEGHGTESRGWFMNLEDGHGDSLAHGTTQFDFVSIEDAQRFAEEAANELHLAPGPRAKFLASIPERFAGRHGEGIMVNLDKPLFFDYPEFGRAQGQTAGNGKASNVLGTGGHPGYQAFDVLNKVANINESDINTMINHTLDDAIRTL